MIDNILLPLSFFWPFNYFLIVGMNPVFWCGFLYNALRILLLLPIPLFGLQHLMALNTFLYYVISTVIWIPFAIVWNFLTLVPGLFIDVLVIANSGTIIDCILNHRVACHFMTGGDKTHHHHD